MTVHRGGLPNGSGLLASDKGASEITDVDMLHQATACGIPAQKQTQITRVAVTNYGPRVSHWSPMLCQFSQMTAIDLSGNAITAVPQSVQNLAQLQELNLSRNNMVSVPFELGCLTSLTSLDLSRNGLGALPVSLCNLNSLQALNLMGNQLTQLPSNFGGLSGLIRLGLKSNKLTVLPESFNQLRNLVELFITDNRLTKLPEGFGCLTSLVKLQASFNPFTSLPESLWRLPRLELFRIAVGNLQQWPNNLVETGGLPSLAWCSLGGNPAAAPVPPMPTTLPWVHKGQLNLQEKLGAGASGEVFASTCQGRQVAVKLFVSEVSPDGSTREEMAINCTVHHPNLTSVLALVVADPTEEVDGSSIGNTVSGVVDVAAAAEAATAGKQQVVGLVLELVHGKPLAGRPTSQHLLRCKWQGDQVFTLQQCLKICHGVASALCYLHSKAISHGDVYAHNVLIDEQSQPVLCDFGAGFCYDKLSSGNFWEAMEVRAFGLFMHDVVERIAFKGQDSDIGYNGSDGTCGNIAKQEATTDITVAGRVEGRYGGMQERSAADTLQLKAIVQRCLAHEANSRPTFAELQQQLHEHLLQLADSQAQ